MTAQAGTYDVVVIGGGLVGASVALLLRRQLPSTASILVIEAFDRQPDPEGFAPDFDVRTTALSHGSRGILDDIGVWARLRGEATPIHTIHVSDRGHPGMVTMRSRDEQVEALGQVVENRHLGTALLQAVQEADGITWMAPAVTETLRPRAAGGMELSVRLGDLRTGGDSASEIRRFEAGLVVLADGGRSGLSEQLGIVRTVRDYEQQAIITNVGFRRSHDHVAFERFTNEGPLALLPLTPFRGWQRAALVWTQPADRASTLMTLPDADFLLALRNRAGNRLGSFLRCGARHAFPLQLEQSTEQVRPGLVLLGNVAHTLHPVAGQGLNLSLRDARELARVVGGAMREGQAPGAMSVLETYRRRRAADQQRTIAFSHHLVGLFSGEGALKQWARRAGLISLDLAPPLRRPLVRAAMGLTR